jgi:hypothetical protein
MPAKIPVPIHPDEMPISSPDDYLYLANHALKTAARAKESGQKGHDAKLAMQHAARAVIVTCATPSGRSGFAANRRLNAWELLKLVAPQFNAAVDAVLNDDLSPAAMFDMAKTFVKDATAICDSRRGR